MGKHETNFFDFNIFVLKLSGVWFLNYDKYWKNMFFSVYNLSVITYMFFYYISEVLFIISSSGDFRNLFKNLAWNITHFLLMFKIILWFFNRRKVIKIHDTLLEPEFFYEDNCHFKPNLILDKFKNINKKVFGFHFWLGNLIPVSALFGNIYAIIFDPDSVNSVDKFGNTIFCDKLPFTSYIPFEINSRFRCGSAALIQCTGVLLFGFSIISLDGIFTGTMCYLTAHINILLEAFKHLRGRTIEILKEEMMDVNVTPQDIDERVNRELNKCINHLQTIIRCSETLESIYKFQTLGQSLDCLLVFCVNLFLVSSIDLEDKSFLSDIMYMLAVGLEFFIYCWFGNELTLASAEVPQALYESEWIYLPTKIRRSIIITMLRMRKPIVFSVGMFSPLTLDTFVSIVRGSYSFFAVLQQMED